MSNFFFFFIWQCYTELLCPLPHCFHLQYFITRRSLSMLNANKPPEHSREILRIAHGNLRVSSFKDLLIESVHVVCLEGRFQSAHFIENTTQRPDIAFRVVRLVFPYFGRGVIGRTCLRVQHSSFRYFAHV